MAGWVGGEGARAGRCEVRQWVGRWVGGLVGVWMGGWVDGWVGRLLVSGWVGWWVDTYDCRGANDARCLFECAKLELIARTCLRYPLPL